MQYADRAAAGRALIAPLARFRDSDAVVLALPRGGLPVAAELAHGLDLPLGLVLVRKVGLPAQPELAVAALAGPRGETLVINEDVARLSDLSPERIEALAAPQRAELARRAALWLGAHPPPALAGRPVILVDDGLATGATMRAAVAWTREQGAAAVIVAVPVGAPQALAALRPLVDDVVCPHSPTGFRAVGVHYVDFRQLDDTDVPRILDAQKAPSAPD